MPHPATEAGPDCVPTKGASVAPAVGIAVDAALLSTKSALSDQSNGRQHRVDGPTDRQLNLRWTGRSEFSDISVAVSAGASAPIDCLGLSVSKTHKLRLFPPMRRSENPALGQPNATRE